MMDGSSNIHQDSAPSGMSVQRQGVVLAVIVFAAHFSAVTDWFVSDDFYWLHVFGGASLSKILESFADLFVRDGSIRALSLLKLHFWFAARLFGKWYPGHAMLVIALHVSTTLVLFTFVRRLFPRAGGVAFCCGALFGLSSITWSIHWISTIHHVYLLLATLLLGICYHALSRTGSWRLLVASIFLAFLILEANEAGPFGLLIILVLELTWLKTSAQPLHRVRWVLVGCCLSMILVVAITGWNLEQLVGEVPTTGVRPDRYTVSLKLDHLASNYLQTFVHSSGQPKALLLFSLCICLLGVIRGPHISAARFGFLWAVVSAFPMSALVIRPSLWYGYVPLAGFLLALVSSAANILARLEGTRLQRWKTPIAVVSAVSLLVVGHLSNPGARSYVVDNGGHKMRTLLRALSDRLVHEREPVAVVLHGVPASSRRPDQPNIFNHAAPLFLPMEKISRIIILVPRMKGALRHENVLWLPTLEGIEFRGPQRTFQLVGTRLRECKAFICVLRPE